ncbi:hypothetical protein P1X14_21015 [Sphingomonas sp. AOB5]|uniref:hypothetical protein n=1 Tax=Sphingomonas sp. AOB5 TaxID=3034017 RepID=UPI0023F9E86C|nr:hypothetical protein [Sphingomonas sp. AOB5]MDF7777750.1 hypothetical protein [Sphingomonas sp. AOB5]
MNGDRIAGGVLVLAALGIVVMMGHHPSSSHAVALGRFVHGALIALIGATLFGFVHLARGIGLDRPLALAGLVAYAIGAFGGIGAGTINGFVMTGLYEHGITNRELRLFAWEANQALAQLGVAASGAAFLLWSIEICRYPGWAARGLATLGILGAVVPLVFLWSGLLSMNLSGAILVYGAHAAWIALAGLYLWSGRFAADRA